MANMAKAFGSAVSDGTPTATISLRTIWTLRLALGFTLLVSAFIFLTGTSWDIQWHSFIGRDRTLIPPHIVDLATVTLSGLVALADVLIETVLVRRQPGSNRYSTAFAGNFHGTLGAYIAGFGALDAAIGFPMDSYWHSLYGLDIAIWAPFHVMIIMGMALVALGAAYMLASTAKMAETNGSPGTGRAAYIGVSASLATLMGILTLLLLDAMRSRGMILLGDVRINSFMFLAGLSGTWILVAAARTLPWRWAATSVVGFYYLFGIVIALVVPPVTDLLIQSENLAYRHGNPGIAIVAFEWPLAPILAALVIDLTFQFARRQGITLAPLNPLLATLPLLGFLPVVAISPLFGIGLLIRIGIVGALLTILLGLLGVALGSWLGSYMGTSMKEVESA